MGGVPPTSAQINIPYRMPPPYTAPHVITRPPAAPGAPGTWVIKSRRLHALPQLRRGMLQHGDAVVG